MLTEATTMRHRFIWQNLTMAATVALLGAGLVSAAPTAMAQTVNPTPPASSAKPATGSAPQAAAPSAAQRGDARVEAHIKRLHDQLKITPAETDQWNAVAQIMRDNEKKLADLVQTRAKNASAMSAVDNLRTYQEIADAHEDGLKRLVPAFDALYAAMSDAQKKNADQVFRQRIRSRAAAQSKQTTPTKPPNG
jgi:periplasmic protein CpxP/Spy